MRLSSIVTFALTPVPMAIVQSATAAVFTRVLARHPRLFDRLGEHASKRFALVPTDLPFFYEVEPGIPTILVHRAGAGSTADATISGPIVLLLALLEGRVDGDALFFARQLEVAGDTEAILALRNALDDSALDLPTDLGAMMGPMGYPVQRGLELARKLLLSRGGQQWN